MDAPGDRHRVLVGRLVERRRTAGRAPRIEPDERRKPLLMLAVFSLL